MSWQIYTAISVLGLSVSIILQRILLRNNKTDPVAYSVAFQALVAVILLIVNLVLGFNLSGIEDVLLIAVVCCVLYGVGTIVYAKTLQRVEASAFSMLFATHAIWVMQLGIVFFSESLTALQIVGSILIFASVVLLAKNIKTILKDKGTLYGLVTGIIYAFAITTWTYVGRQVDTLSWATVSFAGAALVSFLVSPKSVKRISPLFSGSTLLKLLLLGIFYAIGSVAMLLAYKYGTLSLVSPLRQTGIIVTTALALLLLPTERNQIPKKLIAAAISFVGVILLVI